MRALIHIGCFTPLSPAPHRSAAAPVPSFVCVAQSLLEALQIHCFGSANNLQVALKMYKAAPANNPAVMFAMALCMCGCGGAWSECCVGAALLQGLFCEVTASMLLLSLDPPLPSNGARPQ